MFDVAGTIGISGMLLIMAISAIRNTRKLYRQEPIPVGRPGAKERHEAFHFAGAKARLVKAACGADKSAR